ncbi:hypothetical protein PTTG_29728 [Puccinia triticina 1-1 BBBD Race 1]|uniref:Uncharacterized protein n=1 Tax=Puccinia triticina (isolate 1-1 / race 1 (BBBD)) TaxID=630390 RepID=A0A180G2A0_PUCT1|nr:hypothetical protein PTTG_29728 [Puccinia triticina 1-1 BBBD Race 1]
MDSPIIKFKQLANYLWFDFSGVFAISHTSVDHHGQSGETQKLMTRAKYHVTGGLTGLDNHACACLIYRTKLSNKLTYGKLYALKGFLVGAKRHKMPFFMCDVDEKSEVPVNYGKQEIQIKALGRVAECCGDDDDHQQQGTISVIVRHDGLNETDEEDESMTVEYLVPWVNSALNVSEAFTIGRQVCFCGTLGGWNQRLDMMRVKVTSGNLHDDQVRE